MEKEKIKKQQRYMGLAFKFILGLIIVGIAIMAALVFVGKDAYWNSIMKQYNTVAYQVAKTAEGYVTDEEWTAYADLAYRYYEGEATEEEIEKTINTVSYQNMKKQLDALRTSMDANDIFLFVFDMDVMKNFDEEAYEKKEWKPLCYIADSYLEEDKQFRMGESSSMSSQYREDCIRVCEDGVISENYFVSKSEFGYNISAMYPIVRDGVTVACIGVEIPMRTLQDEVQNYVVRTIAVGSVVTMVLLLIAIFLLIKTMIRPIKLVANEAAYFVENNNVLSEKLSEIKTRDEIQTLSENLLKMEMDINDYIENLQAVTAEKERIGAELSVATNIQASMLPCIFPPFPGRDEFDIFASMNPAKEVGGDFYDFFLVDEDHLGLVMADVSGKGVPAALFMVISKTLLKNRAMLGVSPKEILESVNNQLCENNEAEMFVTVWLGIYEISTGKLVAANAGHEYPAICRADGEFELYKDRHGFVLAGMENVKYREYEIELNVGDTLLVYTDGVPEATNKAEELYGTERMLESLNKNPGRMPAELLPALKEDIDLFVGEAPQFDDVTMMALKIKSR
jgi:sigma-B regulation protein RsbU (phosphoserine phosphatase)